MYTKIPSLKNFLMSDEDLIINIDTETMTPLDFKKKLLITFKLLIDYFYKSLDSATSIYPLLNVGGSTSK